MPWIKTVPESDAEGVLAEVYAEGRKRGQWKEVPEGEAAIGSPYSVFTQNGASMKALDDWSRIVRFGKSELSRLQREMVATVTSRLNHCVF
jgi:alkylhydroperoxidase family enzyme